MAGRLPVARRQELAAESYELSLQGYSFRQIARELGIAHPTASALVHAEAKRRAGEREDVGQRLRDSIKQALKRCWAELNNPDASSHATSQNLHALNNLLVTYGKLSGAFAPDKLEVNAPGRLYLPESGLALLSDEELHVLKLLVRKTTGQIPEVVDVLAQEQAQASPHRPALEPVPEDFDDA